MKIGLFGGTFDPIHTGHVDMIRQVCEHMPLDKVIFIPAYIPPHKNKTITPYHHRMAMVKLALQHDSMFEISDYESKTSKPSYTFHTLSYFKENYPNDEFFYIMGVDSFNNIESWYKWNELLGLSNFIIIDRKDYPLAISKTTRKELDKSPYTVYHLPLKTIPISSTLIRQQLKDRKLMSNTLEDEVYSYILENNLYLE